MLVKGVRRVEWWRMRYSKREKDGKGEGGETYRESEKNCCFVSRFGLVLVHLSTTLHQIETG